MILIAGFPYIRKNFSETFDYYSKPDEVFFLLPKIWKVKRGKVIYRPDQKKNILTTATYFHHSHYPLVGGLLKGWMPFFPWHAWQFKKKGGALVYACSEPNLLSTFYFNVWSKIFGLRVVNFTWENIDPRTKYRGVKGWLQMLILKANLLLADGIICGNKKGVDIINSLIVKKVTEIPMSGLNPDYFKSELIDRRMLKETDLSGKIVYSFMGAIGVRKGLETLIEAFSQVQHHIKNSILIIVGSGEYEAALDEKISQHNLTQSVIRIPWADHNEARYILSLSDVFLYPSISFEGWEEQFGYSMAEASLMELPIITTQSGSINQVVIDQKTGILVPPNDTVALAQAMELLAHDSHIRRAYGQAGRAFISQTYSHKVIAEKFKNFFDRVISGK